MLWYGVKVGIVARMSSGILVAVAPSVEAWVDNLPHRRLGGYRAILITIDAFLRAFQYAFPLVGMTIM
jgi:hypothetical protein